VVSRTFTCNYFRMLQAEFRDPRLVTLYDAAFPWSHDDDFFLSVVNETSQAQVLDLGCGTGRLGLGMAKAGHTVTGVDPARASLEAARAKPGADRITWLEGTSSILPASSFEVAVMTSHVAQFFVEDDEWARSFADLAHALVPGGRVVFDTRDPSARGWEHWNPADSQRTITLADDQLATMWTEVIDIQDSKITFTHHYSLADGEQLTSTATLRFRTEAEIRFSLRDAGFFIEQIYGGWHREPIGQGDGEFLVIGHT
jgi:2-polyprenyl-3-methyl-5-hydroxy-6-metoxy-1,4-benzoquinol methylase